MSKALIKTLTPVHIGSGKQFQHQIEFFSENNCIYIIDPEKIFQKIGPEGIDDWINAIDRGISVKDFLSNRRLSFKPEEIALRKCPLANQIKKDKELHEQLTSAFYGPFIPGSSLKGAIKTALLDYITDNHKITKKETIELNNLKKKEFKRGKEIIKWTDDNVDALLFGKDANYKSTRFLKVGDAYFKNTETKVYFTQALNADKDGWELNGNIANLYEAIPENSETIFELKLDELLFKRNVETEADRWKGIQFEYLKKDLNEVCSIINNSTKKALQRELNFFKDINLDQAGRNLLKKYEFLLTEAENCKQNEFVIRVGANSGYNFTTLRWIDKLEIFQPVKSNKEYALLRKEIQKNRLRKDYRHEELWPRTRKMVTNGIPFGFVKISLISDEEYESIKVALQESEKTKPKTDGAIEKPHVKPPEPVTPKAPEPFKGPIKQGTCKIPAQVVKSGKPNIVRLLIKDNEMEMPMMGYSSPLETGKYVYVRITLFSKGKIMQVNFEDFIRF